MSFSYTHWCLIFLTILSFTKADSVVQCNASVNTTDVTTIINTLYGWCIGNVNCADLFYQNPINNLTVFTYLVKPIITQYPSLQQPLYQYVCGNLTDTQILMNLWLLILPSALSQQSVCDANHHLVVNYNQLTSSCVCNPTSLCTEQTNGTVALYIIGLFAILIAFALLIAQLYEMSLILTKHNANQILRNIA